jgi:hypothetical protein
MRFNMHRPTMSWNGTDGTMSRSCVTRVSTSVVFLSASAKGWLPTRGHPKVYSRTAVRLYSVV